MELDRYRKLTQKEVKTMYDKSLEDRYKVKQMEKQMDEVNKNKIFLKIHYFCLYLRKKMKNFVSMLKRRKRLHD